MKFLNKLIQYINSFFDRRDKGFLYKIFHKHEIRIRLKPNGMNSIHVDLNIPFRFMSYKKFLLMENRVLTIKSKHTERITTMVNLCQNHYTTIFILL